MSEPQGEVFSIGETEYFIKPRVTTQNTLNALKRQIRNDERQDVMDSVSFVDSELKSGKMNEQQATLMRASLAEQISRPRRVTDADAWAYMDSLHGIAVVLRECCDNINSFQEAVTVCEQYANLHRHWYGLSRLIALSTGLQEAKNSSPPSQEGAGENQNQEDQAQKTSEPLSTGAPSS